MEFGNYKNNLKEPPVYGELNFSFKLEPVSLQSKPQKKDFIRNEIRKSTKILKYLLSGDVKVEIQWMVHEQERYENAKAPDMDNIIKPILDALSGPEGVLIDDCQVQTIGSHWIDWSKKEHQINVFIKYIPDDFVLKKNLVFVNMGSNLFMPLHSHLSKKVMKPVLDHLKMMFEFRNKVLDTTSDYYQAKMFMSTQRIFHKSRINESFTCLNMLDFESLLKD